MNKGLESLLFIADKILPRTLSIVPYSMALRYIQDLSLFLPVKVWNRNSTKMGNYVFGLSDLDLTLYFSKYHPSDREIILLWLKRAKSLYPFLGETNLYLEELADYFKKSVNIYELKRDPILFEKLGVSVHSSQEKIDKIVFLLRMLYSDRKKLKSASYLRQKKWKTHLAHLTGLEVEVIDLKYVTSLIESLISVEDVSCTLDVFSTDFKEETVFDTEFPKSWKFLFPHRYIWFRERELDISSLQNIKGTILGSICLRQIDWEVWGLMSQYLFLPDNKHGFKIHLERLAEVADILDDSGETSTRVRSLVEKAPIYFESN